MKRLVLTVLLCGVICNGTAHGMWKSIGRFWEDVKRESTKAAHNSGKTISKAWEDTKRESTNFAHSGVGKVVIDVAVGGGVTLLGYPAASGLAQQLVRQIK